MSYNIAAGHGDLDRTRDAIHSANADLVVTVHVAGAKMRHRRDSEGDVDAVVQTKSLIVTDVFLRDEEPS